MRLYANSVLFAITMGALAFAHADLPRTISHQGQLIDESGEPVENETLDFTFRLYDSEFGENGIWIEEQQLQVREGLFNATLGSESPLNLPFDEQYWLGITIDDGDELTPRIPLDATPYAIKAHSVPDGSITGEKLSSMGASAGQALVWEGSIWIPQDLDVDESKWSIADDGIYFKDGQVGINTDDPQHDLHIIQSPTSAVGGVTLYRSNRPDELEWTLWNSDATGNIHFRHEDNLSAWITPDGEFNETSDQRLKADIAGMDDVIAKVMSLDPVRYRYRSSDDETIGFVAQDVKEIFPEVVSHESTDEVYGISYSGMSVIAIQAIQEQQEIIERQEEAIDRLTEQVEYLIENS